MWDDDCDGDIDEGVTTTYYQDRDGDGYGNATSATEGCELEKGWATEAGDDDDCDHTIYPGAPEVPYDGIDQDCDGSDLTDVDGDGYAWEKTGGEDCDDGDADVHPGAAETWYDGVDGDCSGGSDYDADGDGFDSDAYDGDDCDDTEPGMHAGALEVQDGIDDDCDGLVDCEDGDCTTCVCAETTCDDGLDEDDDGLLDCEDDDCWGLACHPAGVRARALGGAFTGWKWRHHRVRRAARSWAGTTIAKYADVVSAWGTVQVLPSGATDWSATTARTTCTWAVAHASFWSAYHRYAGYYTGGAWGDGEWPVRSGVTVGSGCRLTGSEFLPARLVPVIGATWVGARYRSHLGYPPAFSPYTTWYLGPAILVDSTSLRTSTAYGDCYIVSGGSWCGTVSEIESTKTWTRTAVLEPADTWTALP